MITGRKSSRPGPAPLRRGAGRRGWRPGRQGGGGFTLLELVLVLVLISLTLAMAAPSLRGFADARRTSDAASHLLAMTHWARSQAVAEGTPYRLQINLRTGTYWFTAQRSGAFMELEGEQGREFRMPDGVAVRVDAPLDEEGVATIQFQPNGRCDEAVIELEGRQGEVYRLTCDSATERFRIASAEEMQGS